MKPGARQLLTGLAGLAGVAGVLWVGLIAGLIVRQQSMIFNPMRTREVERPRSEGHRTRLVVLRARDGTRLSGWLLTPLMQRTRGAVLYFGGRSEEVSWVARDAGRMFPGMTVLAMNYRGYGDSHGIPGERQMMEDGRLLYDWLAATRSAGESGRIVVVGRSLGSGIAVQLAAERAVTALVLITPYDSILAVASRRFPAMPVSMLLRHRFESVNYVQRIVAPTLVLRAASDNVVPHFHTDSLVAKMSGPVTDETIAHSNHGNIPYLSSAQLRIAGYLDELLSLAGRDRVLPAAPSVATGGNDASGAATAAGGPKFDIVIADLDKPAENLIV